MAADIGQELYEKIKAEFEGRVSANGYIKAVTKRIAEGTATMNDVSLYAKALGSEVRLAIAYNISPEVLPEGQMFYNIAQKILDPLLHDNHSMVNDIAAQVQKKLDERRDIRIKPQKAPFPEDRLGSVLSAASEQGLDEATMKRRMSAPAETMTQSFADDYMKENAKFRTRAGFKEYIVRKEDGKCCEWCSKLAGRYLYPESTPHDVFRRHDNCGCSVTYEDGEMRTRQQVWSKRDWSDEEEQKYLKASDKHKKTVAAMKEDLRLYKEGKLSAKDAYISFQENRRALANIRNLRDRTPVKFTPAQAEALENLVLANSSRAKNPIDISAGSGIMGIEGLTKINEKHQVVNPMDESRYLKMKANLERKGCSVISAKGDDERYLIAFNAEAITDEKGIMHLGDLPSASAFFEETIHYTQIQKYGVLDSTDFIERDAREVAANRKLMKNGKLYGFTQEDYDDVKNNLDFWENDFKRRVGVSYDESDFNREV